jgi:glycolate oxidase iron-sulfur subunit
LALRPIWLLERVGLPARLQAGLRRGLEALSDGPGVLSPFLRALEMIPPAPRQAFRLPDSLPAMGERRGSVALWVCCVTGVLMPQVVRASAMLLSRAGFDVIFPRGQVCCGALALHDGDGEGARRLARKNLSVFSSLKVDAIVTDSAGCGAMMKEYGGIFEADPVFSGPARRFSSLVRDISEFLAEVDMPQPQDRLDARVTYHDACHLAHGQGITEQPRALLASLPGIDLAEMNESAWCCGGAGTYNLRQPKVSGWLAERKVANILATGAEIVAAANPGCQLQIAAALRRAGRPMPVLHPVELLASAHGLSAPLGRPSR